MDHVREPLGGSLNLQDGHLRGVDFNFQPQTMCKEAGNELGQCLVAQGGGFGWSDGSLRGVQKLKVGGAPPQGGGSG